MVAATDWLENKILTQWLVDTTPYLGLWTADPGDNLATPANGAREVSGGTYTRKPAQFLVNGGTATLQSEIVWTGLPSTTVGAVVFYDAPTGGNAIIHGPLVTAKNIGAGDSFALPAANLTVTCD